MAQSIPAQVQTECDRKGYKPRCGIEIPGLGEYISTHATFTTDEHTYTGKVKKGGAPVIQFTVDRLGGLAKISSVRLSILNQELFSNILNTYSNPENEEVIIKLFFDDGTAILDAESVQIFKGLITDFPTIAYDSVIFDIEDIGATKFKMIGTLLTNSDAADTDQGLPESAQGKIKPIIYGDHRYFRGNDSKASDTVSTKNNLVPCIYLGIDSSGDHRWLVSNHKLDEADNTFDQEQFWVKDDKLGRYVRLRGVSIVQNNSSGCIISHANNPTIIDYVYSKGTVSGFELGSGAIAFTNKSRCGDKIFSTASTGILSAPLATVNVGDKTRVDIPFSEWEDQDIDDADISAVIMHVYAEMTLSGGAVAADVSLRINLAAQTDPIGSSYPDLRINETYPMARKLEIEDTFPVELYCDIQMTSGDIAQLDIYECYKSIKYVRNDKLLQVYFGGQGREYGKWINGRSTAEGYSETHQDDDSSGALIENSSGIIESILRDELNFNEEHLAENDFATHAKWDVTGIADDTGGDCDFTFAGGSLNGTLTQTAANRSVAGQNTRKYRLAYTIAVATAPDGDFALTLTNAFASEAVTIPFTAGTHEVTFVSNSSASSADFVINASETTATQGSFTIGDIYLEISEIDNDQFNIASNDLSTSKLSFAIIEQIKSDGLIGELAKVSKSVLFFDYDNLMNMKVFVPGDNFSISDNAAVQNADIFEFDPASSGDSFTQHPIEHNSFKLRKTKDIVTDITILYFVNYLGEFQSEVTQTDTTHHSVTISETYEHKYTKDQTTAELYRDFLVDGSGAGRLSKKYYEVELSTFLNALMIEPFDITNVRHPVISGILGAANMNTQKWSIIQLRFNLNKMEIELTKVQH